MFQPYQCTVSQGSGLPNRIQISKATAEKLKEAGKTDWFQRRPDEVHLKGKGVVNTLLISKMRTANSLVSQVPSHSDSAVESSHSPSQIKRSGEKTARLVSWNVETLASRLREVVARRIAQKGKNSAPKRQLIVKSEDRGDLTCLDEIEKVISMPKFDPKIVAREVDPTTIDLGDKVMSQLREYVNLIANLYRDNPFHNFEHARFVYLQK